MNRTPKQPEVDELPRPDESFLARLHRRKSEARERQHEPRVPVPEQPPASDAVSTVPPDQQPAQLNDADMPPVESLDFDSDYSAFLSARVSESLRRQALRKLFHHSAFNIIDELDEYAEDFTTFEALGDIVTADMRHQIEVVARKQAEQAAARLADDEAQPAGDDQAAAAVDDPDGGARPAAQADEGADTVQASVMQDGGQSDDERV